MVKAKCVGLIGKYCLGFLVTLGDLKIMVWLRTESSSGSSILANNKLNDKRMFSSSEH